LKNNEARGFPVPRLKLIGNRYMQLKPSQVKSGSFGRHAGRLTHYGYDCIPLVGKRPIMDEWPKGCPVEQWARYTDCSLGILTERTPALDVDVLDEELADKIQAAAEKALAGR
jgi:hypothetical protein